MPNLWLGLATLTLLLAATVCLAVVVDPQADTQYRVTEVRTLLKNGSGCPALCRAANGDLLFAYSTVWEMMPPGGVVKLMRSSDEGQTWSAPQIVARPFDEHWGIQMWNGLHLMPDGSLIMAYTQQYVPKRPNPPPDAVSPPQIYDLWSEETTDRWRTKPYLIRSVDNGRTWSQPVRLAPELPNCWVGSRPVTASDGSVLVPVIPSEYHPLTQESAFVRSTDNGKTWGPHETIAGGPLGFNEVTLGVAQNGDIIAILRDANAGPRRQFRQTVSHDNGYTWEEPWLIQLWGKMPDMLTLPSGRILLGVGSVDLLDGEEAWSGPANSSYAGLFISDDNGKTWQRDVMFLTEDLYQQVPFDSPVMALLRNGEILVVHVALNRAYRGRPLFSYAEGLDYVINFLTPTHRGQS